MNGITRPVLGLREGNESNVSLFILFPLRAAGGAASERAVSAPAAARGSGKRPAAAAGGTGISSAEGPGLRPPA